MSLHLQPTIFVLVISTFLATLIRAHNCSNSCGTGKYAKSVPYPFGFSPGCPIQLDCSSDTGAVKIAEFVVQNVTPNGILVDFPPKCDRPIHSIKPLFGLNYALAWQNSLLFQNCTGSLNGCVIPTSMITRRFNLQSCDSNKSNNISCVSQEDNKGINVSSYENVVNMTPCSVLFSSISFDSGYSLHFQRIELEWWLSGSCVAANDCHPSANCTNIQLSNGNGYRCRCNPGFEGDGFVTGDGCRKIVDCNPSKYMAGHCGGTTRVGALVGGIVAGAVLMALLGIACFFIRRRSNLNDQLSAKRLICEAADNSSVPFYPYKEIERATNFFSEKQMLGTGAYGTVYAGKLHDLWVAVKMFRHRDTGSIDKVMNEIKLLTSVSHPNLVRLLGCCVEEGEPILIYEFMPNGTLSQHLQRERGNGLPWSIRLIIAAETAHAIAYLHSAVNPPIYHRDIKSSNILLDFNYNSKVADFGLSRLGMTESSYISTAPQGTPGYLDPEYHQYFHLSDKSDVYSFGVVLVEIITALKVVDFSRPHSEVNLAALAVDRIGRGGVDEIIDPYLEPHRDAWTLSSIHNVAELAFRCLSYHRDMRPTMMEVAEELEHIKLSSWVPASPAMSSCSFSDHGIEMSMGGISVKSVVESGRLVLPPRATECLHSLEEVKDGSPVSVHDPWLSGQSSPSTNSLLGDRPRTVL